MSFSAGGDKNHAFSVPAIADVLGARFVKFDGSYAAADADVVGVTDAPARIGETLSIVTYFSAPVEAAATIAKGDMVGVSDDGTGRAVPGGSVGIAATGGVAGTRVEVALVRRPGVDGGGGGGAIGGGGDSVTQAANSAGKLSTITSNLVQSTYAYSGPHPVERSALGGLLSEEITQNGDDYYVGNPATNIIVYGEHRCTLAQAQAIEAAAVAATITLPVGFRLSVVDCSSYIPVGGGSPLFRPATWIWNGVYFDYDFEVGSHQQFTNAVNNAVTDLLSLVGARWFLNAKHKIITPSWQAKALPHASASGNCTFRVLLNGGTSPYFYSAGGAGSTTLKRTWHGSKSLFYDGATAQIATLAGSLNGYAETPSEFAVDPATTDFTFAARITQGAGHMPFTLDRFALRFHTKQA